MAHFTDHVTACSEPLLASHGLGEGFALVYKPHAFLCSCPHSAQPFLSSVTRSHLRAFSIHYPLCFIHTSAHMLPQKRPSPNPQTLLYFSPHGDIYLSAPQLRANEGSADLVSCSQLSPSACTMTSA